MSVGSPNANGSSSPSATSAVDPSVQGQRSRSVTRIARSALCIACTSSMQVDTPRSTTSRHASAVCNVPPSHVTGCSGDTAGRSTSSKWTSSWVIMPAWGNWVVNGYGATWRMRAGEPRVQRRLAGVGRPDQCELRRAFRSNDERRPTASRAAFLRSLELFGQRLDAALDVRLKVVGSLVLGDGAEHLAQAVQPFPRLARLAEGSLRCLVFGAEIRRHGRAR